MNCQGPFEIYLGNAKSLRPRYFYKGTLIPLDLTLATEIDVAIPKQDGTFQHYLLSASQVTIVSPAILGGIQINIPAIDSANFNVGELQNFFATFTFPSGIFTVKLAQLSVFQV